MGVKAEDKFIKEFVKSTTCDRCSKINLIPVLQNIIKGQLRHIKKLTDMLEDKPKKRKSN